MSMKEITPKTAISILNSATPRKGSYERLQKAFDMAVKALEKQIPKKIENWNGQASCPNCKKLFGNISDIKKNESMGYATLQMVWPEDRLERVIWKD